jgi:hypothetical protein|tara:strand:- start:388 stop:837 length:450 start_codon:yes stop_codon:yes gene_type:complete
MSEAGINLELSDQQREEVRLMLEKYSGKKTKQTVQQKIQSDDLKIEDPDPLETAKPGETVEWSELTPKTRRYSFVRETRALFAPLIMDQIQISTEYLNELIESTGMDITSQNNSLTVCSVVQGDPVRVFQIQSKLVQDKLIIETVRYIV